MDVESGSQRFRVPKTSFQENVLVNDGVQLQLSITTSGREHFCRMAEVNRGSSSGIRLWWSLQDYNLHKITAISADIAGMDTLSLKHWLSNFMTDLAKKSGGRYPTKTIYSIICSLKHYLEEKNGFEALNPLDASDKR